MCTLYTRFVVGILWSGFMLCAVYFFFEKCIERREKVVRGES